RSFIKVLAFFLLLAGMFLSVSPRLPAGRLDKIKKEVKKDPEEKKKGGYHPISTHSSRRESGDYWPPYSTFNLTVGIPPYASGYSSSGDYSRDDIQLLEGRWNITAGLNYFYDLKGDLDGYGLSTRFRTPLGTIDGDITRFRERVETGHDYLNLYYLNYCLSFYLPDITIDVGAGYSGLWSGKNYDGYGFLIAGEVLIADPVLINVEARYSDIHGTGVGDYRAGFGLAFLGAELRARYRYIQFENAPDIHGPEVSIGVRF
ncbi:MAG: hypothetical protein U9O59_08915, partial [Actinomycetota bacterium]|nr:hypothetical protein [Actinomycetota bacterium]